jgi:hypothetical protein
LINIQKSGIFLKSKFFFYVLEMDDDRLLEQLVNQRTDFTFMQKQDAIASLKRKWDKLQNEMTNENAEENTDKIHQGAITQWSNKYPILKNVHINFNQHGDIYDPVEIKYNCYIDFHLYDQVVFKLDFDVSQDVNTKSDKVFGDVQENHDQYIDWEFFTWEMIEPLFRDFVKTFCTYKDIPLYNTSKQHTLKL